MIKFSHKGDFKKTDTFFNAIKRSVNDMSILERYGKMGVEALKANTPVDTGLTSDSWGYEISKDRNGYEITFTNSNIQNGVKVALLLQTGHATRNGGWVEGIDYINPALQPIFENFANAAWKEVSNV